MSTEPAAFYVVGPTASGKSAVALVLAREIGGEIVNADAFQLYRRLDIVSAKPSAEVRAAVPHHLFDVLDPSETCDAQRYREMAIAAIDDILARGRTPIVTGGSGLYIKALTHGFAPLPQGSPELRARFSQLTRGEKVWWLLKMDPNAVDTVNLRNPRYVERALEICLLTGRPQSELRTWTEPGQRVRGVLLQRDRQDLYDRVTRRVYEMLQAGLVEEIHGLGDLSPTAEKAIGIREIRRHLEGRCSLDEAVAAIQQATRRYAKRQVTWFKRETCFQTICLGPQSTPESAVQDILKQFPELSAA